MSVNTRLLYKLTNILKSFCLCYSLKKWFLVQKTYYVLKNCLEVMNNENILKKEKKIVTASLPIKNIDEIELIKDLYRKKNQLQELLFQNSKGNKVGRTTLFYDFKDVCTELGFNEKYSVASWRKTFAYHYYEKYKDISYLMWLFNQHSVNIAFNFIDIEENMNLRFREGVCL